MPYQHKPDISVKLSPRITKATKRMIDQVCRRHEMFEADVLRFGLEAIVPEAASRGMEWLIRQIQGFERKRDSDLPAMVTLRTSRRIKSKIDKITALRQYTEVEVLRYSYEVILPIALRDGFSKIMAMREKSLRTERD